MTTTPSPSLLQDDANSHTQNPNSTLDEQIQDPQQSAHLQTLEISDPQNREQSDLSQIHNQEQEEEEQDEPALDQKEEEDQHQHYQESGMSSISPLASPRSRRPTKRKKGRKKNQDAIDKKVQSLTETLKPVPFIPSKTLNFDKHEKLLRRLGLWDFVHIEFDRNIRVDLVAQLIATYDRESRCGYVNELRVQVNRADLGRALKLPVKKEKGSTVSALSASEAVDLDSDKGNAVMGESIAFIEGFVSNWMLLHGDTWMMPNEVLNWTRAIKEGHPEKVDWAGLIWFMVEKELVQGKQLELEECYYASHLQYLMKSQKEELFREGNKVEAEVEVDDEDDVSEVKMEQEPKVGTEVEVREEVDGSDVKMGQESKVETEVEVREEADGSDVKMGQESKVEEEDGGKVEKGEEPTVEAGVEVEEEKDGGEVEMGKEPVVEAGVEVSEDDEAGGEVKMGKELEVETGVDVKEEEDGGEVNIGKEAKAEASVEVKEEDDGGEVKMGKEPMVEAGVDMKEEEGGGEVKMVGFDDFLGQQPENVIGEEPNVELTLGKEVGETEHEEVKDGDMMDMEDNEEEEQGRWLLDGKNSMGDHFLQRCNTADYSCVDGDAERKAEEGDEEEEEEDEEEEEVEEDEYDLMSRGNAMASDMLTGNLLHGMETTQMPFGLTGQLRDQSDMELFASRAETHGTSSGPSLFVSGSKREIVHEDDISNEFLNGNNKRLRSDGPWSHKSSDFDVCMEEMQNWMGKARMMYLAKEQALQESNTTQQYFINELQRREELIEHLQKTKREELQKKDGEIFRLERDLYLMGNLLEGYRKAVKETHRAFSEYRQRCQLPEEPLYKDAGPGGLVLSTMELEKQRLKQEEEDRLNRLVIQQKLKDIEQELVGKMEAHFDEVQKLEKRLMDSENAFKLLKELSAKPKVPETSECAPLE